MCLVGRFADINKDCACEAGLSCEVDAALSCLWMLLKTADKSAYIVSGQKIGYIGVLIFCAYTYLSIDIYIFMDIYIYIYICVCV